MNGVVGSTGSAVARHRTPQPDREHGRHLPKPFQVGRRQPLEVSARTLMARHYGS